MEAAGNWNLSIKTPMGEQKVLAQLIAGGESLTGTPQGGNQPSVALRVGRVSGKQLGWKLDVRNPCPLATTFAVQLDDDVITGTGKAGVFPSAPVSATSDRKRVGLLMKMRDWSSLLSIFGAFACGTGDATYAAPMGGTETSASGGEPTYWQHVAPILNDKCTACHQTGGIAPFALDNFTDTERRALLIADMTQARIMPPYLMDVGGECGSFNESSTLTDEQIALIGNWARGARLEGSPVPMTPHVTDSLTDAMEVFTPEFLPAIAGGVLAEFDEYRCFPIDPGFSTDAFVTGFEFQPGNTAIVHHALITVFDPNAPSEIDGLSNSQVIDQLSQDGREGWPCFSKAGDGVRVENATAMWAPGAAPYRFPEGVGVRLRPGRQLAVQIHYNLARPEVRGQSDRSRVRLQIQSSIERQAALLFADAFLHTATENPPPDVLEPGNPAARYSWTLPGAAFGIPPGVSVQVLDVVPHMHQRGRKYTVEFGRNDVFECQGHISRWDFNWQRAYEYLTPPALDSDSQVRISCEYDTTGEVEPVLPGWGTRNEMCEVSMAVAFPAQLTF